MKKKAKKSKPKAKAKKKFKVKAKSQAKAKPKAKKSKKAAPKKKKAKKKSSGKPKMMIIPPANSVLLGRIEDYYAHIGVITVTLKAPVRLGDHIHVLGHTTNLEQTLDSMQIKHESVTQARAKDGVGIKVTSRARPGDYLFLIRG